MNGKPDSSTVADAVAEARRNEHVNAARAAMPASEYLDSLDLEELTGTPGGAIDPVSGVIGFAFGADGPAATWG